MLYSGTALKGVYRVFSRVGLKTFKGLNTPADRLAHKNPINFKDSVDFEVSQHLGLWFFRSNSLILFCRILAQKALLVSFIFFRSNWQNSYRFLLESFKSQWPDGTTDFPFPGGWAPTAPPPCIRPWTNCILQMTPPRTGNSWRLRIVCELGTMFNTGSEQRIFPMKKILNMVDWDFLQLERSLRIPGESKS